MKKQKFAKHHQEQTLLPAIRCCCCIIHACFFWCLLKCSIIAVCTDILSPHAIGNCQTFRRTIDELWEETRSSELFSCFFACPPCKPRMWNTPDVARYVPVITSNQVLVLRNGIAAARGRKCPILGGFAKAVFCAFLE